MSSPRGPCSPGTRLSRVGGKESSPERKLRRGRLVLQREGTSGLSSTRLPVPGKEGTPCENPRLLCTLESQGTWAIPQTSSAGLPGGGGQTRSGTLFPNQLPGRTGALTPGCTECSSCLLGNSWKSLPGRSVCARRAGHTPRNKGRSSSRSPWKPVSVMSLLSMTQETETPCRRPWWKPSPPRTNNPRNCP